MRIVCPAFDLFEPISSSSTKSIGEPSGKMSVLAGAAVGATVGFPRGGSGKGRARAGGVNPQIDAANPNAISA